MRVSSEAIDSLLLKVKDPSESYYFQNLQTVHGISFLMIEELR